MSRIWSLKIGRDNFADIAKEKNRTRERVASRFDYKQIYSDFLCLVDGKPPKTQNSLIMADLPKHKYTLREYFEIERTSEEKYEYWDGNVWSMAGASPEHERVVSNMIFHSRSILKKTCSIFGSNLRVKVPIYKPYRYPD
jgi:Putative restriction endonuclease